MLCHPIWSLIRSSAIHRKITVLSGGKIELIDAKLPTGQPVDVFVVVPAKDHNDESPSALDILDKAPGHRLFHNIEEVDDHIQHERDSWAP